MYRGLLLLAFVSACSAICTSNVYESGINERDQRVIVDFHNYYRSLIAQGLVPYHPKASNLLKMKWDVYLALMAQKVADSCEFQFSPVNDLRFNVGQQLAAVYSSKYMATGSNWTGVVTDWFNKNDKYTFGQSKFNEYSQLVWAETNYVGCGYKYFKREKDYMKLYVCHYGPAGNVAGQAPYTVGVGCEQLCEPKTNSFI